MRGLPQTLPAGLYEAAARKSGPVRTSTGSRTSSTVPPVSAIPRQFSGNGPQRTQSPLAQSPITRQQFGTPLSAQSTGNDWLVTPQDKTQFDSIFATVDTSNRGSITGEQAVGFFSNSRLPEEVLAQIWDLSDINSEGQLNKDEFAVAMFLIRQQRGKRDGRGVLPNTLPPSLIPPSMRKPATQPSHPTAPAFDNAPNITTPRSAAEDLFGLDAFTTAPQVAQSTGDSAAGPFHTPTSATPKISPQPTSSTFKPFQPTSSFGQSIAPQSTGPASASPAQSRSIAPQPSQLSDDLLGDADPEVSQRLTEETTELANLSNQVGNLSSQMKEVQGNRAAAEQELSQGTQQKRDFEARLSQLRGLYEQEVKDVKVLNERLTASRNETKKIQQEMAMLDGSYQDLQSQHQQAAAALEADQQENATLKERIRQMNTELTQLKPQLDKAKADARQQKGLVAINKKQLATNEAERDRLKAETEAAAREAEEARLEAEEQERSALQPVTSPAAVPSPVGVASPPAISSAAAVASPAASLASQSTNPFFRRTPSEAAPPQSPIAREVPADHRSTFDSIFGPSAGAAGESAPPVTSFRSESPTQQVATPPVHASPGDDISETPRGGTPSISPSPSTFNETPQVVEPPAPPQSRQITSSFLPMRDNLERADSITSSTRVAPPASRLGEDTPRAFTPTESTSGSYIPEDVALSNLEKSETEKTQTPSSYSPYFERGEQVTDPTLAAEQSNVPKDFGQASAVGEIPGAFPDEATPLGVTPQAEVPPTASAVATEPSKPHQLDTNFDQFFGGPAHSRSPSEKAAEFDQAFASLKTKAPATNGEPSSLPVTEFPPIREIEDDDSDDSSEAPMGFDDDFTAASPPRPKGEVISGVLTGGGAPTAASSTASTLQPRPTITSLPSNHSALPPADAQMSPPTYEQSVPQDDSHTRFPPEFNGLLPSREDPTSPPIAPNSTDASTGAPIVHSQPHSNLPFTAKPPPPTAAVATPRRQFTSDDFDAAFSNVDMAPAQAEDDDDEFESSFATNHHSSEFDPTFDSTTPAKPPTAPASAFPPPNPGGTDFFNFESNISEAQSAPTSFTSKAAQPTAANTNHDWDSIFSGLSSDPPATNVGENVLSGPGPAPPARATPTVPARPVRPQAGRALSQGTEHDDPILKRLTGMGYSRDESLAALERFDYNIDKVSPRSYIVMSVY